MFNHNAFRLLAFLLIAVCTASFTAAADSRPNIIYILADDLGYGDVGCYGQKLIKTPNIDRLAKEGMKFTDHYAGSALCAPSRCVLLTGLHTGHCPIRNNRALKHEGNVPIPKEYLTLGEVMKQAGYATGASPPKNIDGISMLPTLLGQGVQQEHEYLYWELSGKQAVRMGDWKAVRISKGGKMGQLELYNLDDDVGETNNVADQHPEVVKRIQEILAEARRPSDLFPNKFLDQ